MEDMSDASTSTKMKENDHFRHLLLLGMMLGVMVLLVGIIGLASAGAQGATLPTYIGSDMIVTGDESYEDCTSDLGANLIVQAGGNLTLDNVTLNISSGRSVQVQNGGRLYINDSLLRKNQTAGGSWTFQMYNGGTLIVQASKVYDYNNFYLYGPDAKIMDNELTPYSSSYRGIYGSYSWASFTEDGPWITGNTFGPTSNGVYLYEYYAAMKSQWINDNTFVSTSSDSIYIDGYRGTFDDLEISGNNLSTTSIFNDAIYIRADYATFGNVTFNENMISNYYYAVYFSPRYGKVGDLEFSGNDIDNTRYGLYFYNYRASTGDWTFKDNHFDTISSYAFYLYPYSSGTAVIIGDVLFHNNTMTDVYYGIYIYGYSSSYYSYTTFGDFTMTNNTANNLGYNFFYGYCRYGKMNDVVIKNNTLSDISGYGWYFYLYQTSSAQKRSMNSFHFEDNDIEDMTNYVAYLYVYYGGTGETVYARNSIRNVNSYMIYHYAYRGDHGNFTFVDNHFDTNNWGYGAYLYASYGTIEDLTIMRNVIQNTGYDGIYLNMYGMVFDEIRVTNNTIVNCDDGLYLNTGSGSSSNLYLVQNNTIVSNNYYGIRVNTYSSTHQPMVQNNQVVNNRYGIGLDGYNSNLDGGSIDNNTMIKNDYGLTLWEVDDLRIEHNIINSNDQFGIQYYGDWSTMLTNSIHNNEIMNNGVDIYLTEGITLESYNNSFETTTVAPNPWGTQIPKLLVMGLLDISVLWEDGSGPVADAELFVSDALGNTLLDDRTNAQGQFNGIEVVIYTVDPDGTYYNSPFTINASKFGILSSNEVEIDFYSQVTVYLDNVPPIVTVFSPEDMLVTYRTSLMVSGQTEPGATLTVNNVPVNLTAIGTFEYVVDLDKEGNNDIVIEAQDQYNNTVTITLHVIRDTVPPPLEINTPKEGMATNEPSLLVEGETEPGATVKVNEQLVTVDDIGRFEYTVLLAEGENTVTIVTLDVAGNEVKETRTVHLDTQPPSINVLTPTNGLITNAQEVEIRGIAPGADSLKINGINLKLLGETFAATYKLQPGINTLLFEAQDDVGNTATYELTLVQDKNPPALQVISPTDNLFTGNEVLVVSGSTELDNIVTVSGVQVTIDENNGLFIYTLLLREGSNRVVVRALDPIGNTIEVVRNVFLDTQPPILTVTNPGDGIVTSNPKVNIEGVVEVNTELMINGEMVPTEQGTFKRSITLQEGENRIIVLATDKAGNRVTVIKTVYLDTEADVQVFAPADGLITTQDNITFTGRVEDGSFMKINGQDVNIDNESRFSHRFVLEIGTNDFEIVVTDPNGNVNTVDRTVIRDISTDDGSKRTKTDEETTSLVEGTSAWLGAAALGALMGAIMALILFAVFARRMNRRQEPPYGGLNGPEGEDEVLEAQPIDEDGLPTTEPDAEDGPSPFRGIDEPEARNMSDTAAEGEIKVDETEIGKMKDEVKRLEEEGKDVTKVIQSLRMAEIYMAREKPERAEKHLTKANQSLKELSGSSEIKAKGNELDLVEPPKPAPPSPSPEDRPSGIPTIPPPPPGFSKKEEEVTQPEAPGSTHDKVKRLKKIKKKKKNRKATEKKEGDEQ